MDSIGTCADLLAYLCDNHRAAINLLKHDCVLKLSTYSRHRENLTFLAGIYSKIVFELLTTLYLYQELNDTAGMSLIRTVRC